MNNKIIAGRKEFLNSKLFITKKEAEMLFNNITFIEAIKIANENYNKIEELMKKEVEKNAIIKAVWEDIEEDN